MLFSLYLLLCSEGVDARIHGRLSVVAGSMDQGYVVVIPSSDLTRNRHYSVGPDGAFDIEVPAPESYIVNFVVPGRQTRSFWPTLRAGDTVELEVCLDWVVTDKDNRWYALLESDGYALDEKLDLVNHGNGVFSVDIPCSQALRFRLINGDNKEGVALDARISGFDLDGHIFWEVQPKNGRAHLEVRPGSLTRVPGPDRGWIHHLGGESFAVYLQQFYDWMKLHRAESRAAKEGSLEARGYLMDSLQKLLAGMADGVSKDIVKLAADRYLYQPFQGATSLRAPAQAAVKRHLARDPNIIKDVRFNLWLHLNDAERVPNHLLLSETEPYLLQYLEHTPFPAAKADAALTFSTKLRNAYPARARRWLSYVVKNQPEGIYGKTAATRLQSLALVGKLAPDFHLINVQGKPVRLGDFKGKLVYLYFWATWCKGCVQDLSRMEAAYQQMDRKKMAILSICLDKDNSGYAQFQKRFSMSWPQVSLLGENHSVVKAYGVTGFPTGFIISPFGRVLDCNGARLHGGDLLEGLQGYLTD